MAARILDAFNRPAAPRRDWDFRFHGKELRRDLVAQPPHDVAIGTDEHDSEIATEVGELRVLRDKAPTHPDRLSTRGDQSSFEESVIDIRAVRLVRFAIEHVRG